MPLTLTPVLVSHVIKMPSIDEKHQKGVEMSSCRRNTVAMVINGLAQDFRDEREVGDYRITKFGAPAPPPPSCRLFCFYLRINGAFARLIGTSCDRRETLKEVNNDACDAAPRRFSRRNQLPVRWTRRLLNNEWSGGSFTGVTTRLDERVHWHLGKMPFWRRLFGKR